MAAKSTELALRMASLLGGGEVREACGRKSDWLAMRVTSIQIVPKLNVLFTAFPAQEHFFFGAYRRKVDEPAVEIFKLNFPALELDQHGLDPCQRTRPFVGGLAPEVSSRRADLREAMLRGVKGLFLVRELFQPFADLGQKFTRFLQSVVPMKLHLGSAVRVCSRSSLVRTVSFGSICNEFSQACRAFCRSPNAA